MYMYIIHTYVCRACFFQCPPFNCQSYNYISCLPTFQDSSGQFDIRIPADNYRNKVLYRYDPFCVRSSVHIVAEVTEKGRNATRSASIVVPLVSNPISVSFHESNAKIFRPGLPYTLKVRVYVYMYMYVRIQCEHIHACTCIYMLYIIGVCMYCCFHPQISSYAHVCLYNYTCTCIHA